MVSQGSSGTYHRVKAPNIHWTGCRSITGHTLTAKGDFESPIKRNMHVFVFCTHRKLLQTKGSVSSITSNAYYSTSRNGSKKTNDLTSMFCFFLHAGAPAMLQTTTGRRCQPSAPVPLWAYIFLEVKERKRGREDWCLVCQCWCLCDCIA